MSSGILLLAAVTAALGVWLVLLIVRRPLAGLWIGLGSWAAEFTARGQTGVSAGQGLNLALGGINVNIMDVSSVLLGGAVIFVILRPKVAGFFERGPHAPKGFTLGLLGIAILWLVALVRGIEVNGLQTSVNGSRQLFNFVTFATFGAIFGRRLTRKEFDRVWFGVAGALVFISSLFVLRSGFGGPDSSLGRSLNGGQAVIVMNAMLLAALRPQPRPLHFTLATIFGATVLIAQQRTVWATAVFALGIAAMVAIGRSGRLTRKWARLMVGLGTTAVTLALLTLPDLASAVSGSSDVSVDQGTAGWRVDSAFSVVRLYLDRPLNEKLIGAPGGASLERRLQDGSYIDVAPHNTYLFALVGVGLLGMFLTVLLYWSVLTKARNSPAVGYLFPLVASQLIYSIGYEVSPDQGLILGVFAAGAFVVRRPLAADPVDRSIDEMLASA